MSDGLREYIEFDAASRMIADDVGSTERVENEREIPAAETDSDLVWLVAGRCIVGRPNIYTAMKPITRHLGPGLTTTPDSSTDIYTAIVATDWDSLLVGEWLRDHRSDENAVCYSPVMAEFPIATLQIGDPDAVVGHGNFIADSFGSAFSQLDRARTIKGQLLRLVFRARVSPFPYAPRVAKRLEALILSEDDDGFEWNEASLGSLRDLLSFLEFVQKFRYPSITVTPQSLFRAQWTNGPDQHFAVECLGDGEVRFVVFAPDRRRRGRVSRVSGIASASELLSLVRPLGVERWAAHAGSAIT